MKNLFWLCTFITILLITVIISFFISKTNLVGIIINDVFAIGSGIGILYFYNKVI